MKEIFIIWRKTSHGTPFLRPGIALDIPDAKSAIPIMSAIDDGDILADSWGGPHGRPRGRSGLGPRMKEIFIVSRKTSHDTPRDTMWTQ